MSSDVGDRQAQMTQQRIKDFLNLLPLTLEIAGLSRCEAGRYFNEDQMGLRANTIKNAYKVARQVVREIAEAKKAE